MKKFDKLGPLGLLLIKVYLDKLDRIIESSDKEELEFFLEVVEAMKKKIIKRLEYEGK